jgi:hypothetical protein
VRGGGRVEKKNESVQENVRAARSAKKRIAKFHTVYDGLSK